METVGGLVLRISDCRLGVELYIQKDTPKDPLYYGAVIYTSIRLCSPIDPKP